MKGFPGFPDGQLSTTVVPEAFFAELLPIIDHLGEMKTTLYAFWKLHQKTGDYRYLWRDDFASDEHFMRGLSASPRQAQEMLDDALERAEARGTLLHASIEDEQAEQHFYVLNTEKGREALDKLTRGEWRPEGREQGNVTLSSLRSGIFVLYEQNIGPLTPMVVEELRDALQSYPPEWLEDAIRIAVKNGARKLKYILAVLEGMRTKGRYERKSKEQPDEIAKYDGYLRHLRDNTDTGQPD